MSDLISRCELFNRLAPVQTLGEAYGIIQGMPTVDAVPVRHGKWTPVTNGRGGFECDRCHNYAPSYQDGVEHLSDWCPNCGADMRKDGEHD